MSVSFRDDQLLFPSKSLNNFNEYKVKSESVQHQRITVLETLLAEQCFQSFKKLSPENDQLTNALGR